MTKPHEHDFNMRGICVLCGYEIDKQRLKNEVKYLKEKAKQPGRLPVPDHIKKG